MRPSNIKKAELIARLKKQFNVNEPIFTEEILAAWSDYSRPRIFQLLKTMVADGSISKYATGVYYFSRPTFLGTQSVLSAVEVAEKRYLQANGQVFGYYSGLTLLNMVGLTNQVPNTREIVTTKETTNVRNVYIGGRRFLVRRAKTEVNGENAPELQLLEIFNIIDRFTDRPLERYQVDNILALAGGRKINKRIALECSKYFPKRALQNFRNSEVGYVIA